MSDVRTLTVALTDIRGFTDRVGRMTPGDLDQFLESYRAMVLPVVLRHGGTVVKEIGDAFLVTFSSSTGALLACIDLQRELTSKPAQGFVGARIETRIAVSAGDVLVQDGDIFGEPVNLVARLEAITPAGEIYFAEAVYQNLNRNEIASEPVGVFELKGIGRGMQVYKTTFHHQTRSMRAAVLMTDLVGFSKFAQDAPLNDVEAVLAAWEETHLAAAKSRNGVLQHIIGDANILTFESTADAFAAWLDVHHRVKRFNEEHEKPYRMAFRAGLAHGEIRVFRSALYGRPANHAGWLSGKAATNGMLCPATLASGLPEEIACRITLAPADPELGKSIVLDRMGPYPDPVRMASAGSIEDAIVLVTPRA